MCDIHPSAHLVRRIRARLPHTCYSCGQRIVPGETYRQDSGIWDGEPERYRRHELCAVLEEQLRDDEGCWIFGGLAEAQDFHMGPTFRRAWEAVMRRPWNWEEVE